MSSVTSESASKGDVWLVERFGFSSKNQEILIPAISRLFPFCCSPSVKTVNLLFDAFAESHQSRHPGEPRIRSGAGAGVQKIRNEMKTLDSGFRRNDGRRLVSDFLRSRLISRLDNRLYARQFL